MFIRKTEKSVLSTGKKYYLYQLVESFRTEKGPRQRILLNMGSELTLSDSYRKLLANRIEELLVGTQSLFEYPPEVESLAENFAKQLVKKGETQDLKPTKDSHPNYHSVDLNSLEHDRSRTVGVEHIAFETIKKLRLDEKLLELGLSKRQTEVAVATIIGRLASPRSELGTYHWMQQESAVEELLDTDLTRLSLDSVYKVGDVLLSKKQLLENHLASSEATIFGFDNTIVLYDLTNTYFEGGAKNIPKAARGHSKERRNDCPLVTLGLVLNKQGFPMRSQLLSGNISEPSTLQEALAHLSNEHTQKSIVVLDAGIATEENLNYLREQGYCYLVSSRRRACEFPEGLEMELVREVGTNTVHAAQVKQTESNEIYLYCHSTQRQKKEEAMRSLLQTRFEEELQKAADALTKKRGTKDYSKVLLRIGRLKEKHKRISSYYDINITANEEGSKALTITWKMKNKKLDDRFQGGYILRAHGLEWSSKELWNTYVMLTEVEESFRCLKSDLGLRPLYHQKGSRVDAHLFITLLAYHVMQTILYELGLHGIKIRWETLRQKMSTQTRVTTTMRLQSGQTVHVRSSTKPESCHREIYRALNLSQQPGSRVTTII